MPAEFVGIDVSKKTLDVVTLHGGEHQSFTNDPTGIETIAEQWYRSAPSWW
jgi:transposase